MNHGSCKKCFWHKWDYCFMQNVEVKDDSYCPDYYNKKKSKETLERIIRRWIDRNQFSLSELNEIINRYHEQKKNNL